MLSTRAVTDVVKYRRPWSAEVKARLNASQCLSANNDVILHVLHILLTYEENVNLSPAVTFRLVEAVVVSGHTHAAVPCQPGVPPTRYTGEQGSP